MAARLLVLEVAAAEAEPDEVLEAGALLPLLPVDADEALEAVVVTDPDDDPVVVAGAAPLVVAGFEEAVAQLTALGTVTPLARQIDWAN
jgi:hypothetical protein